MIIRETAQKIKKINQDAIHNFAISNERILNKKQHKKLLGVFFECTSQGINVEDDKENGAVINCRGSSFYEYPLSSQDKSLLYDFVKRISNQNI